MPYVHHPYPGDLRALTQEQVGQLLAWLRQHAPRLIAITAWTQYEVAGRIREVLHLAPHDIHATGVRVVRLKRSNPSMIAVSTPLQRELELLAADRGSDRYLFAGGSACKLTRADGSAFPCRGRHIAPATVFRYVQAAGRAIGADPGLCKTHVLRHSAITHTAEVNQHEPLNVTLRRLASFSGHKNLQHLLHYLSNPREDQAYEQRRSAAFGQVAAPSARARVGEYDVCDDGTVFAAASGARLPVLVPIPGVVSAPGRMDGYPFVCSPDASVGRYVHHLVAEAFLGPRPSKQTVIRHLDDDPFHAHLDNLRYGSHSQNHADRNARRLPTCRQCATRGGNKHYDNACSFCPAPVAQMAGLLMTDSACGPWPVPVFACSEPCRDLFLAKRREETAESAARLHDAWARINQPLDRLREDG